MEQLQPKPSPLTDAIKARGCFYLKTYDSAGRLVDEFVEENMVVTSGLNALTLLLSGDTSGDKIVTQIGFGSDGTPPVPGNTSLTTPFTKDLIATSVPGLTSVQYDFSLELTENNGAEIREFGLFTADGSLFARKVRAGVINKTSVVRLEGSWYISLY